MVAHAGVQPTIIHLYIYVHSKEKKMTKMIKLYLHNSGVQSFELPVSLLFMVEVHLFSKEKVIDKQCLG